MHWSGKVFAYLLVVAALVAMVFTAKTVTARKNWAAKLVKVKKEYEDVAPRLVQAKAVADHTLAEWHRVSEFWGPWQVAQTVVNPADASVAVEVGSNGGIRQGQWLYGFQAKPDGSVIFRGIFTADVVREGNSLLKPNWRVRPGDTDGWQNGPWRWRLMLPPSYPGRFQELEQDLLVADETLAERQNTLVDEEKLVATAKEQLKTRESELVGGPTLPKEETLGQEFREGYVAALETAEEERNAQLVVIDAKRRSVRKLRQEILSVEKENRSLVEKLPQSPAQLTQTP
jgi:hypothetical protein